MIAKKILLLEQVTLINGNLIKLNKKTSIEVFFISYIPFLIKLICYSLLFINLIDIVKIIKKSPIKELS